MKIICIRKNICSHGKNNLLFLSSNMAAVRNLYRGIVGCCWFMWECGGAMPLVEIWWLTFGNKLMEWDAFIDPVTLPQYSMSQNLFDASAGLFRLSVVLVSQALLRSRRSKRVLFLFIFFFISRLHTFVLSFVSVTISNFNQSINFLRTWLDFSSEISMISRTDWTKGASGSRKVWIPLL